MAEASRPLIAGYRPDRVLAWRAGRAITAGAALADIQAVAEAIGEQTVFFNLCDDRYLFTVAFAAGCWAGALNLLPQTRQPAALDSIRETHAGAWTIDDAWVAQRIAAARAKPVAPPLIAAEQPVAVVFTSGSTGRPEPQYKRWGDLAIGSDLLRRRFFGADTFMNIVASVPAQHMYGFENSVLLALHGGFAADAARPFMPWQIADALARVPAPRCLFTTPIQLKACVEADVSFAPLARIISATAPLACELAAAAERRWQTEVHEIYGSSETGSIASRRSARTADWRLYDGLSIEPVAGRARVSGGQLPSAVVLDDTIEIRDAAHFTLCGRADDVIKVAGKRISLTELTAALLAVDGVQDAVVFASPEAPATGRPTALVVAPELRPRQLSAALARRVDPVFVPRPLVRVDRLPRNATGKLARDELHALWRQARERTNDG